MRWLLAPAVLALPLLTGGCGILYGGGGAPIASLRLDPQRGPVPLNVILDTSGSFDPDGSIVSREAAVDDGPFVEIEPTHDLGFVTAGNHTVTVRLTDDAGNVTVASSSVVAELAGAGSSSFQVDVRYPEGRVGAREREAFAKAAQRWSRLVMGDLRDTVVQSHHLEQSCGAGYRYEGVVDDLLLFGDVRALDGPGAVVGIAGACLLRADGFPLVGVVVLDRDDVDLMAASGDLETVILHELGHVLDMNAAGWDRRGLLSFDRPGCYESRTVRFTGSAAGAEFTRLGGSGHVPVEDNGVMGTACSHWDEETFRTELMTGYLDRDSRLSRLTGAALADMGYAVDLGATDAYELPGPGMVSPQGAGRVMAERLLPPGGMLDEEGRFTPLPGGAPLELRLELTGEGADGGR
jgi:hypothetical protein